MIKYEKLLAPGSRRPSLPGSIYLGHGATRPAERPRKTGTPVANSPSLALYEGIGVGTQDGFNAAKPVWKLTLRGRGQRKRFGWVQLPVESRRRD